MLEGGVIIAVIVQEAGRMHRQILKTGIKHKCPSAMTLLFRFSLNQTGMRLDLEK